MRKIFAIGLLALLGMTTPVFSQTAPQAPDSITPDVLQQLDARNRVIALSMIVNLVLQNNQDKINSRISGTINQMAQNDYSADTLYQYMTDFLGRVHDQKRIQQLLAWFSSPLGNQLLQAQAYPNQYQNSNQNNKPSQARLNLIAKLDQAQSVNESATEMLSSIYEAARSVMRGSSGSFGGGGFGRHFGGFGGGRHGGSEHAIDALKPAIQTETTNALVTQYQGFSDSDLGQLLGFFQSDEGRWYLGVIHNAFTDAFNKAQHAAESNNQ